MTKLKPKRNCWGEPCPTCGKLKKGVPDPDIAREMNRKAVSKYRAKNRERVRLMRLEYYYKHREKWLKTRRDTYATFDLVTKARLAQKSAKYRQENPEVTRITARKARYTQRYGKDLGQVRQALETLRKQIKCA